MNTQPPADDIDVLISTLQSRDTSLHQSALDTLLSLITKPDLKGLSIVSSHLPSLTKTYHDPKSFLNTNDKMYLSDILSFVVCLTDTFQSLLYRLNGGFVNVMLFGHQYVKKMLGVIVIKKKIRDESLSHTKNDNNNCDLNNNNNITNVNTNFIKTNDSKYYVCSNEKEKNTLHKFIIDSLKYLFTNNCECDAIDFLIEIDQYNLIPLFVNEHNYRKIEIYIAEMCFYDKRLEHVLLNIHRKMNKYIKLLIFTIKFTNKNIQYENSNIDSDLNLDYLMNNVFIDDGLIDTFNVYDLKDDYSLSNGLFPFFKFDNDIGKCIEFALMKSDRPTFYQILFILCRLGIEIDDCVITNIVHKKIEESKNKTIIEEESKNKNKNKEESKNKNKIKIKDESRIKEKNIRNFNEDDHRKSSVILSQSLSPLLNYYIYTDLNILDPLPISKYISGCKPGDKNITLKTFSIHSIANAFINYSFGRDSLVFTPTESNIDVDTLLNCEKVEVIGVIGALGVVKRNSIYHSDICSEYENTGDNNKISNEKDSQVSDVDTTNSKITDNGREFDNKNVNRLDISLSDPLTYPKIDRSHNITENGKFFSDLTDTFTYLDGCTYKKSGSLLSLALSQNKTDQSHSTFALLIENINNSTCRFMKISSLLGIYSLYVNSSNSNMKENNNLEFIKSGLIPVLYDDSIEVIGMCVFVLGSIFQGNYRENRDLLDIFFTKFIEKKVDFEECVEIANENNTAAVKEIKNFFLLIIYGTALLFRESGDLDNEMEEYVSNYGVFGVLFKGMCYMGTGRTDIIESLIEMYIGVHENEINTSLNHDTTPMPETDHTSVVLNKIIRHMGKMPKDKDTSQDIVLSFILISITLISLNDNHTISLTKKLLTNNIKRDKTNIIPLCLSLLSLSSIDNEIIDALQRNINVTDPNTSFIGLGLIGSGTNNKKLVDYIMSQYNYHTKYNKANNGMKIAQGLIHMGKGTLTMSPFMFNKNYMCHKSITSIVFVLMMFIGCDYPLLSKYSFLFLGLIPGIKSKCCVCVESDELSLERYGVRIGKPVQVVGLAGKPRSICGVVTQESPVVIQADERGEIVDENGNEMGEYVEDVVVIDTCRK